MAFGDIVNQTGFFLALFVHCSCIWCARSNEGEAYCLEQCIVAHDSESCIGKNSHCTWLHFNNLCQNDASWSSHDAPNANCQSLSTNLTTEAGDVSVVSLEDDFLYNPFTNKLLTTSSSISGARRAYESLCNKTNSAGVRAWDVCCKCNAFEQVVADSIEKMNLTSYQHIYVKNFPWELIAFGLRNHLSSKNLIGLISWQSLWEPLQHYYVYATPEATKSISTKLPDASKYFRMPFGPPSSQLTTWIAASWRFAPPIVYDLAATLPAPINSGGDRGFCLQGVVTRSGHEEEHGHEDEPGHEPSHNEHSDHADDHSHKEHDTCESNCQQLQPYDFTFYLPGNIPVWTPTNTTGLPQSLPQDDVIRMTAFHTVYWFLYSPVMVLVLVFSLAVVALILLCMRRIALRVCITPCCPSLLYQNLEEEVDLKRKNILSNGTCQRLLHAWTLRSLGVLFLVHWIIAVIFFLFDLTDTLFYYHAQITLGPWIGTDGLGALLLLFAWLELVETVLLFVKKPSEHTSKHFAGLRGFWIDWHLIAALMFYGTVSAGLASGYCIPEHLPQSISVAVFLGSAIASLLETRHHLLEHADRNKRMTSWWSRWFSFFQLVWASFSAVVLAISILYATFFVNTEFPWVLMKSAPWWENSYGHERSTYTWLQNSSVFVVFLWCLVNVIGTTCLWYRHPPVPGVDNPTAEVTRLWLRFARNVCFFALCLWVLAWPEQSEALHGLMAAVPISFESGKHAVQAVLKVCNESFQENCRKTQTKKTETLLSPITNGREHVPTYDTFGMPDHEDYLTDEEAELITEVTDVNDVSVEDATAVGSMKGIN